MAITVNKQANKQRVNNEANRIIAEISENAEQGIDTTEVYCPLDISTDVKIDIQNKLDQGGTVYTFMVVNRRPNPITGQIQCFSGEVIGDQKRYKIRIQ